VAGVVAGSAEQLTFKVEGLKMNVFLLEKPSVPVALSIVLWRLEKPSVAVALSIVLWRLWLFEQATGMLLGTSGH
jgi:hypothetical protein